mmetsp:Transcript_9347/g.22903  ORF Transcript_9347/g.22903 Transcript_9347/m.22903 type:complete len:232 (+) Transcript_9347:1575-2270(+)
MVVGQCWKMVYADRQRSGRAATTQQSGRQHIEREGVTDKAPGSRNRDQVRSDQKVLQSVSRSLGGEHHHLDVVGVVEHAIRTVQLTHQRTTLVFAEFFVAIGDESLLEVSHTNLTLRRITRKHFESSPDFVWCVVGVDFARHDLDELVKVDFAVSVVVYLAHHQLQLLLRSRDAECLHELPQLICRYAPAAVGVHEVEDLTKLTNVVVCQVRRHPADLKGGTHRNLPRGHS